MRASGQDPSTDSQPTTGGIVAPLTAAPYSSYALGVLILVALFNYIDRQSLAIPQIPIKRDLGLSDTQLGALTGLAFALLYSTLALPVARPADRHNRTVWLPALAAIFAVPFMMVQYFSSNFRLSLIIVVPRI